MTRALLLCLLLSVTATASAQWIHQNPVPTGQTLRDVAWATPSMMMAVGDAATIHRSSDGGATWKQVHGSEVDIWGTGLKDAFYAVHAANEEVILAATYLGAIVRTMNGGDTWSVVCALPSQHLFCFDFLDDQVGIAGGSNGHVMRTTDGGRTWHARTATMYGHYYSVAMRSAADWVIATSEDTIFRSADSGATWKQSAITPLKEPKPLRKLCFADSLRGVVVGTDGIAMSSDGGATWRYREDLVTSELFDVAFTSAGWVAVGRHGFIMRSDDGTSWQRVESGTTQDLVALSFRDGQHGVALGSAGTLLHTTDGGLSFSVLRDPPLPQLRAVSFCDSLHGVAVGLKGAILQTSNGGGSWVPRPSPITTDLMTVAWASPTTGIVAGRRELHHTTDGGATWQLRLATDSTFARVAIKGACALAVTTRGELHASGDTGRTWRTVECGSPAMLTAVSIIDDDAWVVAGPRTVLFTDNAGADWVFKDGFSANEMLDMQFIDRRTGWILERMALHRTTNGGATFSRLNVSYYATRLHFADAQRGVLIDRLAIQHTSNGGASLKSIPNASAQVLHGLFFTDAGNGWIVGDNGVILSTRTVQSIVSSEAPPASTPSWTLEAWPQPARGVLNVALRGDLRATVTLRLVDMLGRAVGGVIERAPGATFAVFDVRMLPPGAYAIIASTPDATRVHRILTY